MRTSPGLRAACVGLVVPLLVLGGPAAAEPPVTIGGERLAARGLVVTSGAPKLPATTAASWLVADLDSGAVLAAKDPHGRYAPASTLKALTAATLIPKLTPSTLVTPTFEDVNVEGSKVGLVQQVRYPVSELFTAMLVVSGNDAANALATANGGLAKTVAEMNAEAQRLQAYDTRARNPNGLDAPGQVSSAYDLALIGRAGMQLPAFRDYVATKRAHIRGRGKSSIAIASHDRLLWNYDGAIGIKNGYTTKARATFVGAATRDGRTLVVTLMKTNPRYWPEAAALLDWGFAASRAGVPSVGQLVDPVPPPQERSAQTTVEPVAAKLPTRAQDGLPLLPAGVVAAGLAVLTAAFGRNRRRHRGKLRLPPI
jgi:D-alanyl-D-alanine carboxypeptidase (penicillin-binding protein 5/6)